jgi:FADH2 O2-dependent halogenase
MIPQLVSWLQVLAERYDVPEFEARAMLSTCGSAPEGTRRAYLPD